MTNGRPRARSPWRPPLRAALRATRPYGAPLRHVPVRLDVNENPFPLPEAVRVALREALDGVVGSLNRYPDRDHSALRTDLAAFLAEDTGVAVSPSSLWAANGSNEIMLQLFHAFGGSGRSVLIFQPTYPMYRQYALTSDTLVVEGRLGPNFDLDLEHACALVDLHQPSIVILCSPNNPTGTSVGREAIREVASVAPGLVIVDEAYAEFRAAGRPSAVELIDEFDRIVVTRTLSKAFGGAGVRLGYMAASPAVVEAVQLVRLPYHLSMLTQAAGGALVRAHRHLRPSIDSICSERAATTEFLRAAGFRSIDSEANFILFGEFRDSARALECLADRGVLLRNVGPEGWLRISIGTPAEMERFRCAVQDALPQLGLTNTRTSSRPTPATT